MNIQEYISSGIVESYVLGLASDEERREFEQACAQYPEVLKARTDFEIALEKQAMENALAPDTGLKEKIWEELKQDTKVVSITESPLQKLTSPGSIWWKYAAAACVILLTGSIYINISLFQKNRKLQSQYDNTVAELAIVKSDIEKITGGNPAMKIASLKGTNNSPASYTTVYWDTTSHDVYLLVNNLPIPADSLQYQLWALADGQPIDLGFISDDYFIRKDKLLLQAKNAQKAQAFAITLEKKGRPDSSKPEGQMYVLGNIQ